MATFDIKVNNGKKVALNRSYKEIPDYTAPYQVQLGMAQSTPSVTTTQLDRPIPIAGMEVIDNCDSITGWTASASDSVTLNTTIVVNGTGSINLIKGSGVATVYASKTTTSLDFTSKTLWGNVYISPTLYALLATAGTAFSLRFGSDSSNYYRYDLTKAQLATGNNVFYFTSATASATVGAPTISACDYTYISFITQAAGSTSSANDFVFDNLLLASTANYLKTFVAGYPSFDYTNNEVTLRVYIPSTEANGYEIDSFAVLNNDATPLLTDIDTFPSEGKAQTDEFIFIKKDRMP